MQRPHDRGERGRLPDDLPVPGAAPDLGGERQALLPEVQQDLVGDAQAVELAEQVVESGADGAVRVLHDGPASVTT